MVKVAVIGVGSIGSHHARIFSGLPRVQLMGVADIDIERAQRIASQYKCKAYKDYRQLLDMVDAVSIAAPTTSHFKIASHCLRHGKDILLEKPMTSTVGEAEKLISEAHKKRLVIQVGHLERFNSGVSLIGSMIDRPRFIESRRLSPFLGRGTDVDVTLDLMIHDIDIILSFVKSEITDLRATGSKVLTNTIDVAYAWLEFKGGCIAEVVASRIADEKVRELRVFQHNAYLHLNYQTQEVTYYKKLHGKVGRKIKKTQAREPLREQLVSFIHCIRTRTQPVVPGDEGKKALQVALKISEMINHGHSAKSK